MKKIIKVFIMFLAISSVTAMTVSTAAAATRKRITTVSLSFSSEILPGDSISTDAVDIETKSESYYIGEYEFLNEGFAWDLADVPQLKIYLHAAEGYYFYMSSSKSVKLSGAGADYVSATKQDSSETMVVTVKLSPLSETLGSIEGASLTTLGIAGWEPAVGAGGYEVKLYRNGKAVGSSKAATGTSYNFSSIMTKAADYSFKVRPINAANMDIRGDWVESNSINIDENQAALFRSGVGLTGWKQDSTGWWYQNPDSTYTKENWQQIDGKWYYFNAEGYMMTGWIQTGDKWYYCSEQGDMLVNTTTPDGFAVGEDGAML